MAEGTWVFPKLVCGCVYRHLPKLDLFKEKSPFTLLERNVGGGVAWRGGIKLLMWMAEADRPLGPLWGGGIWS